MKQLLYEINGEPCAVIKIEVCITQNEIINGACGLLWFYDKGDDLDYKPCRKNIIKYLKNQIYKFGMHDYISEETIEEYKKEAIELSKKLFPEYFTEEK